MNLYAYVRGNPTGLSDPLGLLAVAESQAPSGSPRLAGRKASVASFSCGGVPVDFPVVTNVSSHPRIRQIYGRYQRWWGPVPVIPVCVAKIRPSDLALYNSKGGRDALLLAEGFFEQSSWDQHATMGHELTHLWQNIHMGFVHVPGLPLQDQPLEVHAESVGRAFADQTVGKTR